MLVSLNVERAGGLWDLWPALISLWDANIPSTVKPAVMSADDQVVEVRARRLGVASRSLISVRSPPGV